MRITYIHQHFRRPDQSGGTRSYEFARRLVGDGHTVTMVSSGETAKSYDIAGFHVIQLPVRYDNTMGFSRRILAFLTFMARSTLAASRVRADVVLATSTPLTVAIPGWVASTVQRARFVLEVRDLWPAVPIALGVINSRIAVAACCWLERFAYARAAHVIALSPGMADGVRGVNPRVAITVVPNASDLELFRKDVPERRSIRRALAWEPDETVLVYAGSFGRTYSVAWAIRLAHELADARVRIVLVGTGTTLNADRELAATLNLSEHALLCTGPLSKNETANYVAGADIILSCLVEEPALRSLSLNKVFDALAAGRPVLFNHDGWLADLLTREGAGWVAHDGAPATGADIVRTLHADPDTIRRAAEASARIGAEQFSRDLLYGDFARAVVGTSAQFRQV